MTITDRSPKTYGVLGCGQRATYVERCDNETTGYGYLMTSTRRCAWVLDGSIQPDRSSTPPAPSNQPGPALVAPPGY